MHFLNLTLLLGTASWQVVCGSKTLSQCLAPCVGSVAASGFQSQSPKSDHDEMAFLEVARSVGKRQQLHEADSTPERFEDLLSHLAERRPNLVKEIAEMATSSFKVKFLQAVAQAQPQDKRAAIWSELAKNERQELKKAFHLADDDLDKYVIKMLEGDRLHHRKADKLLQLKETTTNWQHTSGPKTNQQSSKQRRSQALTKRLFSLLAQGSSTISEPKLRKFRSKSTEEEFRHLWKDLDSNGDAQLTLEEFAKAVEERRLSLSEFTSLTTLVSIPKKRRGKLLV